MVLNRKDMWKLVFAAVLAFLITVAHAQTPPDVNGTWKCNMEKSTWGASSPPPDLAVRIRQKEPEITITQIVGGEQEEFRFITDGRENVNNYSQGTLKSRMKWDKDVLTVESTLGEGVVTMSDRLALSSDRKAIRMTRHIKSSEGETDWGLLFEKEK